MTDPTITSDSKITTDWKTIGVIIFFVFTVGGMVTTFVTLESRMTAAETEITSLKAGQASLDKAFAVTNERLTQILEGLKDMRDELKTRNTRAGSYR